MRRMVIPHHNHHINPMISGGFIGALAAPIAEFAVSKLKQLNLMDKAQAALDSRYQNKERGLGYKIANGLIKVGKFFGFGIGGQKVYKHSLGHLVYASGMPVPAHELMHVIRKARAVGVGKKKKVNGGRKKKKVK